MGFNNDADWIPLSNALAQVKFWKTDLKQAERFLEYIERFKESDGYKEIREIALEDIKESQEGLSKARFKLEESKNLE